jgi:pantoate--beta-alanine ligase
MNVARTGARARDELEARPAVSTVGLVPTMGALHRGHLSLVEAARAECDVVVVSVFVNPAQFGPAEDLTRYPRDEEHDLRLLEDAGADLVFAPAAEEMYPPGFRTWVDVEELSRGLEGAARPGHFRGVATVCLKLFSILRPQRAYFGQKDAQQAEVVARMISDLGLGIALRVLPTVRDDDGLALSSRNAYLSDEERRAASALPRALAAGEEAFRAGNDPVAAALEVLAGEPLLTVEYVEAAEWSGRTVLAAAVGAGATRLIDNVVLEGSWP